MTTEVHLSADQRHALALLLSAPRGLTQVTLMRLYDCTPELLTGLVRAGFAELATVTAVRGGRTIHVDRVRITDAGRQAIGGS